ncbi:sensor histidine kinase [Actinocorallia populi]|uniref:sensor histidine kinase n=1 Tax=Actinocorallia populi TaxID=2079200 RepID=UPI0018E56897|nr:PAS domain-containing sensor histidine kinase [Actinocorallia populi]
MTEIDPAVLFDAAPAPLALVSPDLVFVAVNQAYEKLLDRSRREIIGRGVFEVLPGGPTGKEAQMLRYSLERVLSEGESDLLPVHRYDVELPGRPGEFEERYWNVTTAPLLDETGAVIGAFLQPQEVTAFVQHRQQEAPPVRAALSLPYVEAIEAHLLAQTDQLCEINQQLRQAHIQERQATEALRKAVQQQREALADASHDLRGPLTGLLMRLQDALDDPEADPREVLQAALQDAERLGDIVGDLLELARLEAGAPTETESVNLSRLVAGELLRRSPKAAVTTHLDPGVIVEGSPLRLARLVTNLLANAERHARSRLETKVSTSAGQAVLEVIDDGPGIPDADKEAVFRRFYRRADARRSDPGGTGLGLAIARQIAQLHGGTLRAADRTDHRPGARLILSLPLRRSG